MLKTGLNFGGNTAAVGVPEVGSPEESTNWKEIAD
jgi:hypothetical protein